MSAPDQYLVMAGKLLGDAIYGQMSSDQKLLGCAGILYRVYAVQGVIHYLRRILEQKLETTT